MCPKLIILVEDDVNLRQSIALILQRAGYLVTATDCVYEAMDLLRSETYQLVISDNNIPETKKILIPKIVTTYQNLSLVILTDQSIPASEKESRFLRIHYLVKPLAPEGLIDRVGMILGKVSDSHLNGSSLPDNNNNNLQQGINRT